MNGHSLARKGRFVFAAIAAFLISIRADSRPISLNDFINLSHPELSWTANSNQSTANNFHSIFAGEAYGLSIRAEKELVFNLNWKAHFAERRQSASNSDLAFRLTAITCFVCHVRTIPERSGIGNKNRKLFFPSNLSPLNRPIQIHSHGL